MTLKKCVFPALAALALLFTSCSDYLSPVKEYLEEYTEMVIVLDHEITTEWSMDAETIASVPSASPAILRFQLSNTKRFALESSIHFSDPDVEASRTADSCRLSVSTDRQSITLELSPAFLALHEGGGDLSATLTLAEAETGRQFPSYQFALRANTPPPAPVGSRVMTDTSGNYVVCFNLDLSNAVHQDLSRVTINDDTYTITSVTTGAAQNLAFAESGISTTEPAGGLNAVGSLSPFASQAGMTQVYVSTGIDSAVIPSMGFTITVFDRRGLSQVFITTTEGDKLPQVRFEEADHTPIAAGTTITLAAPANVRIVNPIGGATVSYTVTRNGTPYYSGSFSDSVLVYTMNAGGYQITAHATMPGFLDSDPVTITVNAVSPTLYISNSGDDSNAGTSDSPMKSVSAAYARLVNKNDPNNRIVLLSDITSPDGSGQLANLNITEATQLTIDGQGHSIDALYHLGNRGMTVTGSADLDLTLRDLTIRNADVWMNGAGLYIYNTAARVVLEGCFIERNSARNSGSTAQGAGIYFWGTSLTLHGTTVTMNSLEDTNNLHGAGIFLSRGDLTIDNNSKITSNTITGYNVATGAGVHAEGSGTVTMQESTIIGNKIELTAAGSWGEGAGLHVSSPTCMLDTCIITGNEIDVQDHWGGAGVYRTQGSSAKLTLKDTTISGNFGEATNTYGGGVYMGATSVGTMDGGEISGNYGVATNAGYGGGIFMGEGSTVTMTGGEILNNRANLLATNGTTQNGDGVYITGTAGNIAKFTLNSGNISGNKCPESGIPLSNTAFYLDNEYAQLILGADAQVHSSNVVYLNDDATIVADKFLTKNPVAALKFPDSATTGDPCLVTTGTTLDYCRPAANYYKFTVENISGNPYCINADGNLSEVIEDTLPNAVLLLNRINTFATNYPGEETLRIDIAGSTTNIAGAPSITIPQNTHVRIVSLAPVTIINQFPGILFDIQGHLLLDGANLTIDCEFDNTIRREQHLFDLYNSPSLVARNVSIIDSGIIPANDQQSSLVSVDEGTVVLEQFEYRNTINIPVNSATSALLILNNSMFHFVSGSIDSFIARHSGTTTIYPGVATVAPTANFYIHDGSFTNNSQYSGSSVGGIVENPNGVPLN